MMRTQSPDTSLEMERFQIAGLRRFPPARKFASVCNISASMIFSTIHTTPAAPHDYERAVQFVRHAYPPALVTAFQSATFASDAWTLQPFDLLNALMRVHTALHYAGIPFALMGAAAYGIYGFPGGVDTLDLLVDVREDQIPALIKRLRRRQMVVGRNWRKTFRGENQLHILSLHCLIRINCVALNNLPYDQSVLRRARQVRLADQLPDVLLLAPEDCVIQGLVRYHMTGERDDALYNDLLGVLKMQRPSLNDNYLQAQARKLDLQTALAQIADDADIEGSSDVLAAQSS